MGKVGTLLKDARESRGLTFEEISEELKIHPRFLRALEEGDYGIFADKVHIRGFLKNYAEFLGLDVNQILAFWRREYADSAEEVPIRDVTKPIHSPRFVITPQVVAGGLIFVLVIAFLGYLFWQYRSIAGPPRIKITSPKDGLVVSDPEILVEGFSDPAASLRINDQKVALDEDGKFSLAYILSPGTNILSFVAVNRFGKETKIMRRVVYEEPRREFTPPRVPLEATPSVPEATRSAQP